MGHVSVLSLFLGSLALSSIFGIQAESPYVYLTWRITYATIYPGNFPPQRGILINGQFPGPTIGVNTNDNLIITIINDLDDPFLMTWNGIWQRKNSWQDGVLGTNCPIPPRSNYTYTMQVKDQIGTYMYFPFTLMHRVSGGFGSINVYRRSVIALPYPEPAGEHTLLIGDWYKTDHKVLQKRLDNGYGMPMPDGLLINGLQNFSTDRVYTGQAGKTYLFRVANVGIMTSINVRIQDHTMKLVEVEGSHVLQETYESLDVHPGQSLTFLVTLNGVIKDYYIVASTRFTRPILSTTATLHYDGSIITATGPLPSAPAFEVHGSMKQARTFRRNLTANAARPNPQGSFRYGEINITRTLVLGNSAEKINGKLQYGVNNVSYVNPTTPLKLADYYNIPGVFDLNTSRDKPTPGPMTQGTIVYGLALHDFVEIIFQNNEATTQSWHLDGYNVFVVGFGSSEWTPKRRSEYNLVDAVSRSTVQVFRNSWTAVLGSLDNKGMWNLRSAIWHRQYLGQQVYLRVWNDETSLTTEYDIPPNALKCGNAAI
ncbi:L-ascorbate oxidase homolog [Spinacia oleracea]|uniref:L-ascorbate oxidase homolog n=1 Tax=Spinacia oleracea TaxID=3562 RepID=A0A9R0HWV0_SPIOL|nr:L-ascorbate oxidase homolog [Spinacia oleracea]XP_021838309.1 L-ascorbate oxidase homolog [Spinacia oleracea]